MTQSNWCNQNYWYLDDTLSTKSTFIPRDAIDDTNIVKKNYTYVIAENACFQKIPSLVCNNLNIIVGQNAQPDAAGSFTCALLEANNVICANNITLSHWEPNTFCEWTVSSLATSSGCTIKYLILDANSNTGLHTTRSSLQNCYVKSNNLYLDNTSVSSSDYITKILCTSGILVDSTINNRVIFEGDFSMNGTTNFGGSGNGSFIFNESSINAGTINGLTAFNDNSINQGIIYSNVLFSGASSNNGIVVGDCVFLSGTKNLGTISGNALFSGLSINSGIIINNGFFNSGAINFGIVSGISKFDYAINNGTISESYFTRSINATDGVVTGLSVFNESINSGILNNLFVDFSFVNNSINKGGTIFGNVVFDSGCTNRGLIYNTSGYVIFKKDSINYENIESNSITFTDDSQNGYGDGVTNTSGLTIFSKNAINYGTIGGSGSVEFYNLSLNNTYGTFNSGNFYHSSINRGTLNIAYFHQDAVNFKTVSSGIFNGNSINKPEGSGNNLCFNNSAINSGFAGTGNFADNSYNFGTGINLQFCHRASNSGTSLEHAIFWSSSINLSGATNSGFVTFNNTSKNYSIGMIDCRFVFKDNSANYGNVYSGIFLDFSKNSINTTGYNLNFYDDSTNNGTVTNLGLFMGRSVNKGIVLNSGIFYNLSSNRSPAVIQDSLFLHYSSNNSSYKIDYKNTPNSAMDTPRIVFSGYSVNQGNIVDSYVQFGDHATNKNSIEWNSKILFTSSGIFVPGIDQNGKEKYFHLSGPDGTYETDVSEFIREFYNCRVSSFYSWPQIIFNDSSTNSGSLIGYYNYIFNSGSSNYGSLYTYPVIPNLHTIAFFDGALNFGNIVNGKTVFSNSINSGTVLFPYFENSTNYGDILGVPTLSYYPYICNGFYLEGVSGVQFINSTNFGRMDLFGSFETSTNFGNINNSGSFDNSNNFGFVANNAIFINSYSNGDIGGNLEMTNSTCISSNIRGKANFINSTYYGSTFLNNLLTYQYYYERSAEDESWIPNINNILNFISLAFDPITGSSLKFNGETISNDVNFINSKNFGGHLMKSAYFQNGINFGDIEGFSRFAQSVNAYNSTLRGISIFSNSTNYGILNTQNFNISIDGIQEIEYTESIINSGILINYPQLSEFISSNKIGSILDNSINRGTVNTPSIFTTSINYYLINGPTAFIAQSNNNKNNNVAYGYNEAISYIPPYPLYSPPIYIYRYNPPSTETYSRPHIIQAGYGLINSDAIFINSDNNAAVQNAIFYQSNNNGIIQGNAILNYSTNDYTGFIIGENTIFNASTNYNAVSGNAIFISGSNRSNGLVTGDAVFVSGSCNNVFARVLGQITNDGTMSTNC